ncbi:hypothetical protein K470DRAFT_7294 [Piedraia hortae CBS 480.64]|uniref:Uncharacterized protein n=1 Tax=Piedraia hortae CBS 480.64 TaxID=1314780 RepID=A0A6A7C4K3_9PEZI|nr:hypothetical protein K470DRAFT_7294 [Piedraia hortae CBS 480.64]
MYVWARPVENCDEINIRLKTFDNALDCCTYTHASHKAIYVPNSNAMLMYPLHAQVIKQCVQEKCNSFALVVSMASQCPRLQMFSRVGLSHAWPSGQGTSVAGVSPVPSWLYLGEVRAANFGELGIRRGLNVRDSIDPSPASSGVGDRDDRVATWREPDVN